MHLLTQSLLNHRFLRLTHLGRLSRRHHQTMVEVIGSGSTPEEVIVVAGRGHSTDWYRDIQTQPAVEVALDRRRFRPTHRVLYHGEALAFLSDYERAHRSFASVRRHLLSRVADRRYDDSGAARQHLAREYPLVAFRPADERSGDDLP